MAFKVKRIIDGKTYNTETATEIEGFEDFSGGSNSGDFLFQTRFGAFFRLHYYEGGDEHDYTTITPLTPDKAREWLEEKVSWQPELIEKLFGEMPEAGSGEVKFTLRMPESLRDRISTHAEQNKQSLNAWMIRCLERCATDGGPK
ncbi:MAG: toxin-antitoxin system HicB family antitoxin [Sulfitobacter sp.]